MVTYRAPSEQEKVELRRENTERGLAKKRLEQPPTVVKSATAPKQQLLLLSAKELMNKKFPPSEWLVDGLLRMGRKRPSLILGRPGSGKSTLALQLAVNVTQGKIFLGRQTIKSDVIFWQSEESEEDIQDSLKRLGYNSACDNNLLLYFGERRAKQRELLFTKCVELAQAKMELLMKVAADTRKTAILEDYAVYAEMYYWLLSELHKKGKLPDGWRKESARRYGIPS